MPFRYTMLLQMTTDPADRAAASPHTGGWSESHWRNDLVPPTGSVFTDLLSKRALLLPKQSSIVGYRISTYTIAQAKLLPGPVSTGRVLLPGSNLQQADVPQMALEMGASTNAANSSRFSLRGTPDNQVQFGEYQPDSFYKTKVTNFSNSLVDGGWALLGRDLTQGSYRVFSIIAGLLTVDPALVAFADLSYIRLRKVKDTSGNPVIGSFAVSAVVAAGKYQLAGFDPTIVVGFSGTARRDLLNIFTYVNVAPSRITVRKIGRPFEQYRGRRSKRPAA